VIIRKKISIVITANLNLFFICIVNLLLWNLIHLTKLTTDNGFVSLHLILYHQKSFEEFDPQLRQNIRMRIPIKVQRKQLLSRVKYNFCAEIEELISFQVMDSAYSSRIYYFVDTIY